MEPKGETIAFARTSARKRKLSETMNPLAQGREIPKMCGDHSSHEKAGISGERKTFAIRKQPLGKSVKQRQVSSHHDSTTTNNSSCTLDPSGPETPEVFLKKIMLHHCHLEIDDAKTAFSNIKSGFFDSISEEEMRSYADVVTAVRQNNVPELQRLLESGYSLNCCNSFGESLVHIACRRGFVDTVKLLLKLPNVLVRVADDCGRTPLHDLCWNPTPQFELCRLLLEREPSLFFLKDKRNFSPFDYTREEHWEEWKRFLVHNKSLFERMGKDDGYDWMFTLNGQGLNINPL